MSPFTRKSIGFAALWLGLIAFCQQPFAAATLLPNGEQCFQATTGLSGMVGALGTITPGTGGTSGTYSAITLTGSVSGQASANATIVVSGGAVASVTILNPGFQYVVGDVLTATSSQIGNVSGFSVPVNSISINSSLAGGSVAMYVPNTTTAKQTWQNATQTVLNANPVSLNANGCAIMYGTGSYRQQLFDSLGNLIWDQVTADTSSSNSTFWAGLAGGTPNAITVTDPGFNGTDGTIINFIPLYNNTGPTTLNPSSYFGGSPPSIVKDTTGGPVALVGGEIIATTGGMPNVVSVVYSATYNEFHLLNTAIQSSSGAAAPLCGASGLKMVNGSSNSTVTITANSLVTVTSAGLVINRSNVSFTMNVTLGTSTSAAGGMDGETLPTSTAAWIDIFAIDNGSAAAGLGTLAAGNGQSPNFPTGYTYKCYLGAFYTNTSNALYGEIVLGNHAQYVNGGANLTHLPNVNGTQGSTYSLTTPTYVPIPLGGYAPPTATAISVAILSNYDGNSAGETLLAPNSTYKGANDTVGPGNAPPCNNVSAAIGTINYCNMLLESTNIYYAASSIGAATLFLGWTDAVNAN